MVKFLFVSETLKDESYIINFIIHKNIFNKKIILSLKESAENKLPFEILENDMNISSDFILKALCDIIVWEEINNMDLKIQYIVAFIIVRFRLENLNDICKNTEILNFFDMY